MITDDDVKKLKKVFATKDDLKGFATKDDLKQFATKDDLKGFATKDDLNASKNSLQGEIRDLEERMDVKFDAMFKTIHEFRDETFNRMDKVYGELLTVRQEQTAMTHRSSAMGSQLDNHERRIGKLEQSAVAS